MKTGIYIRVEENGKWVNKDLIDCTPEQREGWINTLADVSKIRLINMLLDLIKEG